ncbi:MAG: hypothetical protein HS117_23345 [Verrucomicrobiaceae bacterium]|nr:hypothetical protein [Verrucomicrobiaceae bacterium]
MKSISASRFFADSSLVDALPDGEHLAVKAGGKTWFIAVKGGRPRMTAEIARQRAVGSQRAPRFDGAAFLKTLKKTSVTLSHSGHTTVNGRLRSSPNAQSSPRGVRGTAHGIT